MILPPPNFLKKSNGCSKSFSVRHGISSRNEGLFISCHNEVRNNLLYPDQQAFPFHCVLRKPLINQVHSRSEEELHQGRGGLETRNDIIIRGLWERQTESIIGVIFGDLDAYTYNHELMDKLLSR